MICIAANPSAVGRGVIGVAIAGGAVVGFTLDAVPKLIGVLTSCVSEIEISIDIQVLLGK